MEKSGKSVIVESAPTDSQTDRQTNRQTDRQTDRQTHRQTHRQTVKLTERQSYVLRLNTDKRTLTLKETNRHKKKILCALRGRDLRVEGEQTTPHCFVKSARLSCPHVEGVAKETKETKERKKESK